MKAGKPAFIVACLNRHGSSGYILKTCDVAGSYPVGMNVLPAALSFRMHMQGLVMGD